MIIIPVYIRYQILYFYLSASLYVEGCHYIGDAHITFQHNPNPHPESGTKS